MKNTLACAAFLTVVLSGCAASPADRALPPIPSASNTNLFSPGATVSDASEMSVHPTDNPSIKGSGTSNATASRK